MSLDTGLFDDTPIQLVTDNIPIGMQFCGKHIGEYVPLYATPGSSGVDLKADIEKSIVVKSGDVVIVPTGIMLNIPSGLEAQVRSRSGLAAKHGTFVVNSPGTIDSDYRGEIKVIISSIKEFTINPGDRIAQLVFAEVKQVLFDVDVVENNTSRGSGGFGSTGV